VCALPSGHVAEALDYLGCRSDVLSLDPYTLDEVLDTILAVGERAGVPERAATLVIELKARLAAIAAAVAGRSRRRVLVVEWVDPPFGAGHWIPDLVRAAGGEPVGANPGGRSAQSTWDAMREENPDVVLVAPCGFDLAGAVEQARGVAPRFPDADVWAIDADALVVRPGPRLVDGVAAIASILHPDAVPAAPEGAVARSRTRRSDAPAGPAAPGRRGR
jgi:iron complex transport system substrate-binding protein